MPTDETEAALAAAKARCFAARRVQQDAAVEMAKAQNALRDAAIQWEREYFAKRPLHG